MGTKVQHKSEGSGIRDLLQGVNFHRQIMRVLPKHLPPNRFIRVALTAIQRNPDLLKCDKESFFNCLLSLTELALEPDGRRAHLIPFWSEKRKTYECQLIIDYKGYVDLITRPGKGNDVSTIYADVVYEHDDFSFNRGIVEKHIIDLHKTDKERGKVIGAYTIIRMKDGAMKCEVMNVEAIAKVRARSKASAKGPWVSDENEMRKKTVLRRSIKTMPLNDQTAKALEVDYDRFDAIDNSDNPKALAPADVPLLGDPIPVEDEQDQGKTKPAKKMPKPQPGENEPPDSAYEGEGEQPPDREPGQDDDQPAEQDAKGELFDLLRKQYGPDQLKMRAKLKSLTAYKTKGGYESKGKESIDQVTEKEAVIALAKLKEK